jgi:putative ABC transport system permease protein
VAALLGWLLINFSARLRGATSGSWRYGIANMKRHAGGSLVQIMALALGLMAMLLLTLVRTDLIQGWQDSIKPDMPNRFIINMQSDQLDEVKKYFSARNISAPELFPMVRGRLVEINDKPMLATQLKDERARRTGEREFNLSWAKQIQPDNKIVAGAFWPADTTEKQFSVEEGIAKTLGIKLNDTLTFDIAGSRVTAKVTSLRKVEWDSFKANFFVLGSPGLLDGFAASYIASFYLPPGNESVVNGLVRQFSNISVIDLTQIMQQVKTITNQVGNAVSFVFLFALAAGIVVLYAAIAATQDERVFDAAIMRTLGASRKQMMVVQLAEFMAIGLLAGLIASVGAMTLAAVLSDKVFGVPYTINWVIPFIGIFGGGIGIAIAGLLGTRKAVSTPPLVAIRGVA